MLAWDPDGPDAQPPQLIVAGSFSIAGNINCANIASWDGTRFTAMGSGLGNIFFDDVEELCVFRGELYAAGGFYVPDTQARNIARWDGRAWQPLGLGIDGSNARVSTLTVFQDRLVVGGVFAQAGGQPSPHIATWDGAQWHPVLIPGLQSVPFVHGTADELLASLQLPGFPTGRIMRWSGAEWSDLPGGLTGSLSSVVEHNGEMILGGGALTVGTTPLGGAVKWNGSGWQQVGNSTGIRVDMLLSADGQLFAIGDLAFPGNLDCKVATLQGNQWVCAALPTIRPNFIAQYQSSIYLGGGFAAINGRPCLGIGRQQNGTWSPLAEGMISRLGVSAIAVVGSEIVFAGDLTHAGSTPAANIAAWNGRTWRSFDTGWPSNPATSTINAITQYNGQMYAGGNFYIVGAAEMSIVRWNGTTWLRVGSGIQDGIVYDLQRYGSDLIVGGFFNSAGSVTTQGIAAWNGLSWRSIGGVQGYVTALEVFDGQLIAAGNFNQAGGVAATKVARWNGASWQPMGSTLADLPQTLHVHNGALIAAGRSIWRWTPSGASGVWTLLGRVTDSSAYFVRDLETFAGDLYAVGDFQQIDGILCNRAARWNERTGKWEPLGVGFDQICFAVEEFQGQLVFGGAFLNAGGRASPFWARWTQPTTSPVHLEMSASLVQACIGQEASLSVEVDPSLPVSFQWRRGTVPLSANPRIVASLSPDGRRSVLHFSPVLSSDASLTQSTSYNCLVISECGTERSNDMTLRLCEADLDCSGAVSVQDIFQFLDYYAARSLLADASRDGSVTVQDVFSFLNAYFAGCP